MKITLNSQFYNKKREFVCPKCKNKVVFTFNQLGKIVTCPKCKSKWLLDDNVTPKLKNL